jgi:hypothetical protein
MTQDSEPIEVWVVAQVLSEDGKTWELGGVFTSRDKALAVCTQPNDAIFPVTLDHFIGRETVAIPAFWPVPGPISSV